MNRIRISRVLTQIHLQFNLNMIYLFILPSLILSEGGRFQNLVSVKFHFLFVNREISTLNVLSYAPMSNFNFWFDISKVWQWYQQPFGLVREHLALIICENKGGGCLRLEGATTPIDFKEFLKFLKRNIKYQI